MIRTVFVQCACSLLLAFVAACVQAQDPALFAQSASAALQRQFGSGNLSWILLDRSGEVIAQNWPDAEQAISPGSLLKPFLALAYGEQHHFAFPRVQCTGTRDRCWRPRGHGALGFEDALAQSCNAYFLSLAADVSADTARSTARRFGLEGPPPNATPAALIGLESGWREQPLVLARAYRALLNSDGPMRNLLASGMEMAAQVGTAAALDSSLGPHAALAKTGTAACTHHPRAAADGFAIVLYPSRDPRILLLLRMHGATGAQTSTQAAAMLRAVGIVTR